MIRNAASRFAIRMWRDGVASCLGMRKGRRGNRQFAH